MGNTTQAPDRKKPGARFYFSFRSPYSWLGYRDLIDRYPGVAATLDWRPFWEPDELSIRMLTEAGGRFPYVDHSKAKARYVLQDARRLARQRGLSIVWPVDRNPCWERPHLAYIAAERLGAGEVFIANMYRARWEQGRDITDPAVLSAIAEELGLPTATIAEAANDPDLRTAGCEALLKVDADGVFGVPFFISGHEKFWGVDRLPWFIDTVLASRQPSPDAPDQLSGATLAGLAADQGHAGGCG